MHVLYVKISGTNARVSWSMKRMRKYMSEMKEL
uniref:Uncharacterized protein n=1 Tax=Lepeophtheirus salmonis TaxID=72036 RepID=A0A0K2TQS7_LEPSM